MYSSPNRLISRVPRYFAALIVVAALVFILTVGQTLAPRWQIIPASQAVSTTIVISQFQVAGGVAADEFVELHNVSASNYDLNGHRLSYRSAAGGADSTFFTAEWTTPTMVPAGGYYLVAHAKYDGVPVPDKTYGSLAMSDSGAFAAAGGGLALRNGAPDTGTIIDSVGYGTATNAFIETAVTTAPAANASKARLNNGCQDTDNNSSDFTLLSPSAPRNSATTAISCAGLVLNIGDVSQAETNASTTTFNFAVTLSGGSAPAGGVTFNASTQDGTTNPATAGSDYVALVNQPGSISQGNTSTTVSVTVNGDTTPEPNETFFVNLSAITNAASGDVQGLGTIQNDDVSVIPIYTIQGSGMSSPFIATSVTTTGIVTARKTNGFFLQDPAGDANLNTSDGIFVFTSTAPTGVAVGDSVQVTGTVVEFESSTTDEPDGVAPPDPKTLTEISSPSTIVLSGGNPLPAALSSTTLNIFNPVATSRGAQLEKYESMRVLVDSLTVSQPTDNFAEFWGVESPHPRPFRAPGIEAGDPIPAADQGPHAGTSPPNVPVFDGNFERIQVDTDDSIVSFSPTIDRRPTVSVTTGAVVTNIVGPLDYAFDSYRIVLDVGVTPGVTPGVTAATPVPTPLATEFTIASANLENFTSSAMNFPDRLNKASLAVRDVMRTPDILGVIEVANQSTLDQLATQINNDVGNLSLVNYDAFLGETAASQDIGFLVNLARVTPVGTPTQHFVGDTFTYAGQTDTLHDRPPYILTAHVPQDGGGIIAVTVILNHTKSLIAVDSPRAFGVGGTEGARNREKRRQQAEDIADLIQARINQNLVMMGDLNAFDFSDGLGDVVSTMRGVPPPPNEVVEPSTPDVWNYELINLSTLLPADQRYSFAFEGNAQALDHILVNNGMFIRNPRFAYARYNGDFSESYADDANRPERLSDHDAAVAYFSTVAPTADDGLIAGRITDPNGVPIAGAVVRLSGTQNRKSITDANGNYHFDNVVINEFYTVTPSRINYTFSPAQRSFNQLGNSTEAAFAGSWGGDNFNPLDTPEYFVRQQYLDVLGREPDEEGFNYWSDEILHCGSDTACANARRRDVAAAFFIEREFQDTGSYIYDAYKGALGRRPVFSEYSVDRRQVVGGPSLGTQKQAFVAGFVQRAEFVTKYQGHTTADSFVDALLATASQSSGVDLSSQRASLINKYQSGANMNQSRSLVLHELADSAALKAAEYNAAFVLTEYFSYLQRNPEPEGYNFWLNVINNGDVGNYRGMVCSFITSTEYQKRFSSVVTHSNAECGR